MRITPPFLSPIHKVHAVTLSSLIWTPLKLVTPETYFCEIAIWTHSEKCIHSIGEPHEGKLVCVSGREGTS